MPIDITLATRLIKRFPSMPMTPDDSSAIMLRAEALASYAHAANRTPSA